MEVAVLPSRSVVLLRALLNILLGAIIVIWPAVTLLVIVLAFAINILLVGIITLFEPIFDKYNKPTFLSVILGILGIVAGIFLITRPILTGEIVALLIAFWALLFGIFDIYAGFAANNEKVKGSLALVLVGLLSLIFGIYVLFNPLVGALSLIWAIGLYTVIVGIVLAIFGLFFYPKKSIKAKK